MIEYRDTVEGIEAGQLTGFFVDLPKPPSPEAHLRLLTKSSHVVIAVDAGTEQAVGFVSAISDGVLSAYIPLLEVLPEYRKRGIGTELVRRMMVQLADLYMVDLMCDADLQEFYQRFGMQPAHGMIARNYKRQAG